MPAPDLSLLVAAAREAGEIAAGYAGPTARRWDKPGGAGPVTEADIAVNEALETILRGARPEYGWLSEESEDDEARLDCERVFILDPIDGTRSFIEGTDTWAHSLAVTEAGRVTAAVVYLPMRGKLYAAAEGQGATLNGRPIRAATREDLAGAEVLAGKPGFDPRFWRGPVPDMKSAFRPSIAYRLSLVAEGRFDAMFTLLPTWEWDVAAGALILGEAGAVTTDRRARPLVFNNPEPRLDGVVAANRVLHRALTGRLA